MEKIHKTLKLQQYGIELRESPQVFNNSTQKNNFFKCAFRRCNYACKY